MKWKPILFGKKRERRGTAFLNMLYRHSVCLSNSGLYDSISAACYMYLRDTQYPSGILERSDLKQDKEAQ